MNLTLYGGEVGAIVAGIVVLVFALGYALYRYSRVHAIASKLEDAEDRREEGEEGEQRNGEVGVNMFPNLSLLYAPWGPLDSSAPAWHTEGGACGVPGARGGLEAVAQAPLLAPASTLGVDPSKRNGARRFRWRRRNVRRVLLVILALAFLVGLSIGIFFLLQETVKQPGEAGFEATERYHGIIKCGGRTIMVTRMRVFSYGKFAVVLRYLGDSNAYVHSTWYPAAFNPGLFCHQNTPYLIGSASSELHLAGGPPPGEATVYNIDTGTSFKPSMEYSSCTDLYFKRCTMDGKFSVVTEANNTLRGYIRANAWPSGGGRWAQTTTSNDGGRTWSPFQMVEIDGIVIDKNVNIYTFLAVRFNATHLRARYPAVTPEGSGVWQTYSTDGVRFSRPTLLRHGHAHGPRVDLQPVEHVLQDQILSARINLHLPVNTVALYAIGPQGGLQLDTRWKTARFVWV